MERLLEAEMSEHLGHEPQGRRRGSKSRNGHSRKTVQTESGPVEIQVPRDREGSFEPALVKKLYTTNAVESLNSAAQDAPTARPIPQHRSSLQAALPRNPKC
jgi:transposase-like protein